VINVVNKRKKGEQEYYHKRKEAHKIIRNKKKTHEKCNKINRRRSEA
jgi:hypothetical protein